ncbi:radical SAM protein [Candidatus Bathyarchaeota archaeon]|nr:radical SAM protein [Candidatus Bathyarchaeota archaeon]
MSTESFWEKTMVGEPCELPLSEKGRYIFPYPYMAIVADPSRTVQDVRIPVIPPPEHSLNINSLVLQATIGCPWNRCLFCTQNINKKFRPRPDEVKEDILLAKKQYGDKPQHIFLADGNSFVLRTDKLLEILTLCFQTFPNLKRVSTYGSARFIVKRGLTELKSLSQAGLTKIYLGVETGDGDVLKYMDKGATPKEMIMAAEITRAAEIELSVTTLLGLGGVGNWKKSAELTAQVLNLMKPPETRPHNLIIDPDSPLGERATKGEFQEASRYEILKEKRLLIDLLTYETKLHIHRFMIPGLPLEKKLPDDKKKILDITDFVLYRFYGESVDLEKIKDCSIKDVLEWDGYRDVSPLDDI